MNKVITTEMSDRHVDVVINLIDNGVSRPSLSYQFPFSIVNPRVALQIATLLVSDPTIPQCDAEKEK